jgi:hypothetical protein
VAATPDRDLALAVARVPQRQTGTVGAAGTLTLTFSVAGSRPLTVSQVSVEMATGADLAIGAVRYNGVMVAPFVPTADAVGGDPPIVIAPGDLLTAGWTGATPGSVGSALFIYDDGA